MQRPDAVQSDVAQDEPRRRGKQRETVIAKDGGLYIVRLGDRVMLELLACADQGIALFVDIDRRVFLELPVLGNA
jgi:hypothetical protein